MLKTSPLIAAALLALTACSDKAETEKPAGTAVSVSVDGDESDAIVDIQGDSETGKMEISLPGGFASKVNVPGGLTDKTKFDIDGVGLYPGAKVGSIKVNAVKRDSDAGKSHTATVKIGFTAPADAAAVADWYQQQFDAKKIAVSRSGETLTGKTEDGDDFTLALTQAASGANGVLTLIDAS